MKKILLCTTITLIATGAAQISAMAKTVAPSLNRLERGLVVREIKRRGTNALYNQIQWQSDLEKPEPLIICDAFNVKGAETDPLIKNIFDRIRYIEEHSGYITETQYVTDSEGHVALDPTNFLGKNTRYYWTKHPDGTHLPIISIYCSISDFNAVKKIIDEYDTSKE